MYLIQSTSRTNPMYYSERLDQFVRRHWATKFATEQAARDVAATNRLVDFVIVNMNRLAQIVSDFEDLRMNATRAAIAEVVFSCIQYRGVARANVQTLGTYLETMRDTFEKDPAAYSAAVDSALVVVAQLEEVV